MNVSLAPKEEHWRGRGHPRRTIPPEIQKLADGTYKTGRVGIVTVGPDDEEDVAELRRLLVSYAKSKGRRMRIQRDDDAFRFEMVDTGTRKAKP